MLNGKFFTGLPPKMIDRNGASKNRLESHFFWPDDTKLESAVETRVRRRASFQLDSPDKAQLERQTSVAARDGRDTKQMFRNEFTKSSIQFSDNLQEDCGSNRQRRQPLLARKESRRNDITAKPTAIKPDLVENVVDEGFSIAKKKQDLTSKIQFYDFVDEDATSRNKFRNTMPQMDRNDKKQVERNTKNSPKLQVKRNVRNLNFDEPPADSFPVSQVDNHIEYGYDIEPEKSVQNLDFEERRDAYRSDDGRNGQNVRNNRRYMNEFDGRSARPTVTRPTLDVMRRNNFERREPVPLPRRILRNPIADERTYNYHDDYSGADQYVDDVSYTQNNMRDLHVSNSPKKHVTYEDEVLERHHDSDMYYEYDREEHFADSRKSASHRPHVKTPNSCRPGSGEQQQHEQQQHEQQQHEQQQQEQYNNHKVSEYAPTNTERLQYMETGRDLTTPPPSLPLSTSASASSDPTQIKLSLNNKYNNNNNNIITNNNNNNSKNYRNNTLNKKMNPPQMTQTPRKVAPKISPAAAAAAATRRPTDRDATAASTPISGDKQKHLRSSLLFHDGEMIADNGASSATAASQSRRNARSSATQRVSVGLPA